MKILVLNTGSSSLKFELFKKSKNPTSLASGLIDRIGKPDCKLTFKSETKDIGIKLKVKTHDQAVKEAIEILKKTGTIEKNSEITLVGHRVVHGGEHYQKPIKIDAKVIKAIKELASLAPLHNPANLKGITAAKKLFPKAKHAAVFDTAFYQTLPKKSYLYAIPKELYEKYGIRRYGFHGTNHQYVTETATKLLNNKKDLKIISIHLGNGSSITASLGGQAIDTTMGFTPLEGLPMGTRSGTIDPSIVLEIQKIKRLNPKKTDEYLNEKCGLLALSGISSDMREIYGASLKKDPKALETIEYLAYKIAKQIGAYAAALNGVDAIIFTAGMGEKAFYVREQACEYLTHLGIKLDKTKNRKNEQLISSTKSKSKVFVIPADEEYYIAKNSLKI
jgi:acetate kinase